MGDNRLGIFSLWSEGARERVAGRYGSRRNGKEEGKGGRMKKVERDTYDKSIVLFGRCFIHCNKKSCLNANNNVDENIKNLQLFFCYK